MTNLKEQLKREFEAKKLDQEQLDTLNLLQTPKHKSFKFYGTIAAVAASLVLVYVNVVWQKEMRIQVAEEVAYNHNKRLDPEIITDSYDEVRKKLDKLDFNVIKPEKLVGYTLVGARYCSIKGKTAAQLKLVSPKGETYTLYQYMIDSQFDRQEVQHIDAGVKVRMWTENGVHFAVAGPK